LDNATRGIDLAFNNLGCPKLILPEEMVHPKVDELAMMTYISYLRDISLNSAPKTDWAGKCRAYGHGLVEGIVNETSEFTVELPEGSQRTRS
jgi:filamin